MANTPNINLVKPLGTDRALVSVINDNSDKIDAFAGSANTNMANTQNGYAIVVDGNNAPKAITAGQYLFIKNHSTLSTGGYHATANIANGAAITSSNVAADADGVVNGAFAALNSNLANKQDKITWENYDPNDVFEKAVYNAIQALSAEENKVASLITSNGYHFIAMIQKTDPMRSGLWIDVNGVIKMLFSLSSGSTYQKKVFG